MPLIPGPSPSSGLFVVDQPPAQAKQVVATTATPSVAFPGPNAPLGYLVDRITVKSRATVAGAFSTFPASSSQAYVWVGPDASTIVGDDRYLCDLTLLGDLDIADEVAAVYVDAGQVLAVSWINATVGALYTARLQYRVIARGVAG